LDSAERKRAEEALELRARLASLGATIGVALAQATTIGRGLQQTAEAFIHYTDSVFARIWTVNEKTDELELEASAGMYTQLDGHYARVAMGQLEIGRIAQLGESHWTNDVPNDPGVADPEWAKREGIVGFAGYPLAMDRRTVGVAAAFSRKPFREPVLQSFALVSVQLAEFITRKRAELQFVKAKEAAEATSRAQSAFLASMSYQIRTALSGIIGMTDAVLGTELEAKQRDDLNSVRESANSLLKIIDDVSGGEKIAER
jgi:signal transduction histidine kinase